MNKSALNRDLYMLKGPLAARGYDWWWHNFTGYNRKTGEEKTFFVEYFVCNPALGREMPVLGQLPKNRAIHRKPSYALIKAGAWGRDGKQIHNFYPISRLSHGDTILNIRIGNCLLTETRLTGRCSVTREEADGHPEYMCDAGTMEWDLRINKEIAYHVSYGASDLFRKLNAFEMFWHAEGIKTGYGGTVILDGEVYDVVPGKSYGYADKNWGRDFTSPWLWLSSCDLTSRISGRKLKNSAVELGGGSPKVFGAALDRKLLGGIYYEGKMYDYNFSKFWTGAQTAFRFYEGEHFHTWKVRAVNRESEMEMIVKCPREEMLLIHYESPDGEKRHNRLWNGGTGEGRIRLYKRQGNRRSLIDDIEIRHTGCEYGEYDE